jgi:glycosyltransferase involved in cell wall biosynthesis
MASPAAPLRILALEPYYGGSHRAVLDGLVRHIDAEWTLLTLPARKWKWRMRGSAITMAAQARVHLAEWQAAGGECEPWDLLFASTFINLAEFKGLAGAEIASIPAIAYFHENQLVYPNRHEAEWDFQFPLTNITSALAADRCLFNTRWNLERFVAECAPFLKRFPDHHPVAVAERIAAKSAVVAPPFDPAPFDGVMPPARGRRARIVWPHRWEHDKDPETFFAVVSALADEGLDFEVAVAGQVFKETADSMQAAAATLGDRLVHVGEPSSRAEYAALLASADIAVSTAINEFFGLAMIEACYAGCLPLVPDRLAYPEIYATESRYGHADALLAKLRSLVLEPPAPFAARGIAEAFTFDRLAPVYAGEFERVAARRTVGYRDRGVPGTDPVVNVDASEEGT